MEGTEGTGINQELFDFRLFALRLLKRAPVILLITGIGMLLCGGGYLVRQIFFAGEDQYEAKSVYSVAYGTDPRIGMEYTYINAYSWNVWVHTEEFLNDIYAGITTEITQEELKGYVAADLPSNLRMPVSVVTTNNPALSLEIAGAVEQAFVRFGDRQREIISIKVESPARTAEKVLTDSHPLRVFVISGILVLLVQCLFFLIREMTADAIWLPRSLERRYGLAVLGTMESWGLRENLQYFFRNCRTVGITSVEEMDLDQVLAALSKETDRQWVSVPSVLITPEGVRRLRETDGVLLVVRAGNYIGKKTEDVLDFLKQQDCRVTAALLWDADERLIRMYYSLERRIKDAD